MTSSERIIFSPYERIIVIFVVLEKRLQEKKGNSVSKRSDILKKKLGEEQEGKDHGIRSDIQFGVQF